MNGYKQFWADDEFVKRLENIKAKRTLNGLKPLSMTKLTKEMIKSKKFQELEDELVFKSNPMRLRYEK